jgi:hypothetical protein
MKKLLLLFLLISLISCSKSEDTTITPPVLKDVMIGTWNKTSAVVDLDGKQFNVGAERLKNIKIKSTTINKDETFKYTDVNDKMSTGKWILYNNTIKLVVSDFDSESLIISSFGANKLEMLAFDGGANTDGNTNDLLTFMLKDVSGVPTTYKKGKLLVNLTK